MCFYSFVDDEAASVGTIENTHKLGTTFGLFVGNNIFFTIFFCDYFDFWLCFLLPFCCIIFFWVFYGVLLAIFSLTKMNRCMFVTLYVEKALLVIVMFFFSHFYILVALGLLNIVSWFSVF